MTRPAPYQDVLTFWFGKQLDSHNLVEPALRRRWFQPTKQDDQQINRDFHANIRQIEHGSLRHWLNAPRSCLAFVIVCDQFTRQVFRGTKQAFSLDHVARTASCQALQRGWQRHLAPIERVFFYFPFEHSESLVDQRLSERLFAELAAAATSEEQKRIFGDFLRYARQHREIIDQFGRFPHRNRLLGRKPTRAEREYLDGGGPSFGQNTGG